MLETAKRYLDAGLCVLPAIRARKRPAVHTWKEYQNKLPDEDTVEDWFSRKHDGVCLLAGRSSGNLEMIDFDQGGEMFNAWSCKIPLELLDRLVIETSQSGGRHVVYRCEDEINNSMKLAKRASEDGGPITLIETRGNGGLFLCAPTAGYEPVQGDLTNPPVLTSKEREILLQAAWEFNEYRASSANSSKVSADVGQDDGLSADNGGLCEDNSNSGNCSSDNAHCPGMSLVERAKAYLDACDPAISGQGGHNQTFFVAQALVNGFCLEPEVALRLLLEHYNPRCEPPWMEKELQHKVNSAEQHPANKARGWLRDEGFGVQEGLEKVDYSGIINASRVEEPQEENETAEVPPIPDEFMRVPGFVGEVMDFCLKNTRYPSVPLAFSGAMALQSYLCSRKVREEGGLRPNLYILALAGSGHGKGYPRKINAHVLGKLGCGGALGNHISSGQGLEDEMYIHRKMLYQTDEIDNMIYSLATSKDALMGTLLSMLLQFYSEADETHVMRTKARTRGQTNEIRGEIDQPGMVLFGTATPTYFYEAMSPRLLTNGLFSRSIVIDVGDRGRKQRSRDVSCMPAHIVERAKWWKDYNPAPTDPTTGLKPNLDDEHPTPAVVPYTEDGYDILDELGTQADDIYDAAMAKDDQVRAVLWTRVCENATRLALVYACSRDHKQPCIDREAAEWATRFARHLAERMLYKAGSNVAENPFHAECLKVVSKLRAAPGRQLSHSELLKRMKTTARDFQLTIDTMIQQGDIVRATIPSMKQGRPQVVYRLCNGG